MAQNPDKGRLSPRSPDGLGNVIQLQPKIDQKRRNKKYRIGALGALVAVGSLIVASKLTGGESSEEDKDIEAILDSNLQSGSVFIVDPEAIIRKTTTIDNTGTQDPDHNHITAKRKDSLAVTDPIIYREDGEVRLGFYIVGPTEDLNSIDPEEMCWVHLGKDQPGVLSDNPYVHQVLGNPLISEDKPLVLQNLDGSINLSSPDGNYSVAYAYPTKG